MDSINAAVQQIEAVVGMGLGGAMILMSVFAAGAGMWLARSMKDWPEMMKRERLDALGQENVPEMKRLNSIAKTMTLAKTVYIVAVGALAVFGALTIYDGSQKLKEARKMEQAPAATQQETSASRNRRAEPIVLGNGNYRIMVLINERVQQRQKIQARPAVMGAKPLLRV